MAAPRNDPGFGGGGTGIVQNGGLTTTTSGAASTTVQTSQTDGTAGVDTAVYNTYGRSQIMVFTDVISEGPIEGLVNEGQSILLNGDPLVDSNETILRPTGTFGFTSSSSTVTVPSGTTVTLNTADKYIIAKAGFSGTATISAATTETSLNITSTVFNNATDYWKAYDPSASVPVPTIVRLADQTTGEIYFEGKIESFSGNTAVCSPIFNSTSNIDYTATYDIYIDRSFKITAVDTAANPDELTISPAADFSGSKLCIVTASIYDENTPSWAELFRYDAGSYLFKTGEAPWGAMGGLADSGIGSQTGIVVSNSHPIEGPEGTGGADNFQEFTLSTLSGLSASLAPQIDELKILFNYSSMYSISTTTGNEYSNGAKYKIQVNRKIQGSFQGYETVTSKLMHVGFSKSAITFEHKLPLEVYQPFQDLKVKITRLTEDEVAYENLRELTTVDDTGYNASTKCSIGAITAIIKEPLVYPYTALGRVTVSTKQFSNPPKRTYHCKGLKVQIPSNYDPVNRSYAGNWDGSFDSTKQYTNNPAWVFYDMLTSKRYGLGNWLLPADIDKWSLYRIAKYCDEQVPDGNGSTEPRFTSNLYITKSTDAYKLLKDMATIFRGILFWMDGLVTPVMDASGDAIANFSSSNVIDGDFKYESTGNRTRSNQIIVTWNNPLNGYKQEALIVEDVENIIKTGKVIAEEAVAFGCTSEGQALRYGRWKLWTAINQTEIVNFQTGINGAFLKPGDLINVQDPNRYPQAVRYGGRVSSASPLSTTTTVNLDSEVTLNSGSSYELSVLLPTAGAYLNQDIYDSGTYVRGDNIPASEFAGGVINEETVANFDGQVIWSEHSHTETLPVSNSPGTTDTITVTGSFSSAPDAQSAWVLRETSDGYSTYGSAKLYRVLGITEDEPNLYTVNAVEHYNEKFDSVDSDFTLSIQDPVYPRGGTDLPPPPRNFVASVLNEDGGPYANDILLTWDKPLNDDGSIYSKQSGYLIEGRSLDGSVVGYDVAGPNETRRGPYYNLGNGEYRLSIRTQADGKQSDPVIDYISVGTGVAEDVTRYWGIPLGGTLNTTASISSAGEFSFGSYSYRLLTSGAPTISREFSTISPNDTYVQDCSGISADYFPSKSFNQQKVDSYYIFFDASESTLKLVKRYNIPGTDLGYVYDAGNGSNSETTYWTSSSGGTITISSGSTLVTGSGTSFTTDFQIGDLIRIDGPSPDLYAVVDNIQSDTVLYLDRVFDTAISSSSYSIPGLRIDRNNDALLGYVRNESDISPAGSPSTFNFYPLNLISEGVTGRDAISISLSNETDSLQCNTSGNILAGSFTGTGTTIKVFEGVTQLVYDPTSPYAASSFNVTAAGTGITPNASPTADTAGTLTYGDASDAGSPDPDDIYIDFTIDVVNSQGETFQFVKRQTFSKSVAGADGITGGTLVTLYQTGNSAPSVPSGDLTYTYSTGVISGATLGSWSQSYQSVTSGAINLYAINATVIDSNPTSSPHVSTIATGDWSTPEIIAIYTENGEPGLRTIQGYLYYEKTTAGAPSAPSGNTYTFSTGLVSGTGIDTGGSPATDVWRNSPNVQDPTSTNTHYIVRYYGTEAAASATTIAVTYSSVSQHTNFDSVVTFSGGTFSEGATPITTIDGGNISTGTVTLDKLNSTYAYQAGENGVFHQFALDSLGETTLFGGLIDVTSWFFSQDTDLDLTVTPNLDGSVACVTTLCENLSGDSEARDAWSLVALNKWGGAFVSSHDSDEVWGSASDSWAGASGFEYAFDCGGHTFSYYGDAWLPSGWVSSGVEDTLVEASPTDLAFSRNGDILYIVGTGDDRVYQFPLTTAWDVTTRGTSTGNLLVSSQTTSPQAMFFSYDGTILYVASSTTIYRYNLTTAWDVTTASYSGDSQTFGTNITGIFFDRGGFRVYVSQSSGNDVTEYALGTSWDITTVVSPALDTYNPTGIVSAQGIRFKPSGDLVYILSVVSGNYTLYTYRLGRVWDLSSASNSSESTQSLTTATRGFYWDPGGNKLFLLEDGGTTADVREYSSNLSLPNTSWQVGDEPTIEHGYESSWNGYADKIGQPIQLWASDSNYANGYITEVQDDQFDVKITSRTGSSTLPEGAEIRHPSSRVFGIRPNGLITGLGGTWSRLNDVYHDGTTKYDYAYRGGLLYTTTSTTNILLTIASKTITVADSLPSSIIGSRIVVKGKGVTTPIYPNYYITGIITAVSGTSITFDLDAFNGNGATGTAVPDSSFTVEVYDTGIEILGSGKTHIYDTTASTSATTGALIVDGGVGVAGDIYANGDITAYASSDARLKDNLQVIPNALTKVDSISGYTFEWNDKSNKEGASVGVVAQEIQEVLPEVVVERDTGYLAVQYEKIIPLLIEAIKELKKEVEELKSGNRS